MTVRRVLPWSVLCAATAAAGLTLDRTGLASPTLFAALLVGIATALLRPGLVRVPATVFRSAQAVRRCLRGSCGGSSPRRAPRSRSALAPRSGSIRSCE